MAHDNSRTNEILSPHPPDLKPALGIPRDPGPDREFKAAIPVDGAHPPDPSGTSNLLVEAIRAFNESDLMLAREKARAVIRKDNDPRAWKIIATVACVQGEDATPARSRLSARDQEEVQQACTWQYLEGGKPQSE